MREPWKAPNTSRKGEWAVSGHSSVCLHLPVLVLNLLAEAGRSPFPHSGEAVASFCKGQWLSLSLGWQENRDPGQAHGVQSLHLQRDLGQLLEVGLVPGL